MRRPFIALALLLVLFLLAVSGCAPQAKAPLALSPTTAMTAMVPTPVIHPTVTATPQPQPTNTLQPARTPVVTSTRTVHPQVAVASLPHYRLEADLDYYGHRLNVRQWTTVTNDSGQSWSELVFNVSPAYWPGRFELADVTLAHAGQTGAPAISWSTTMLHIHLAPELLPGETVEVNFNFHLNLPQLDPVGWAPDGNAGWSTSITQVGDWYPALIPFREETGWQTWSYHPVGDPVRSRLADYELVVTSQPEVTIVAPGRVEGEEAGHQFRLQQARAVAFLASPEYVKVEHNDGPVPVSVYVIEDQASKASIVLDAALQALDLFSTTYGHYPYEELIIAQNGYLTAMEYSALISLSDFAFNSYQGTPDALLVAITAHEVAHQWFYSSVGSDQVEAPWLDESMAMVSEWLFYEAHYPELVEWWWHFRVDRWQPQGPVDVAVHDYADSPTFVHNMYGRAAHFMRELRLLLGEDAFIACLHDYYTQNRQGWATEDDFFASTLYYASSEELRPLVDRYFKTLPSPLTSTLLEAESE